MGFFIVVGGGAGARVLTRGEGLARFQSPRLSEQLAQYGAQGEHRGETAELLVIHHKVESALYYNIQLSRIGDSSTLCR